MAPCIASSGRDKNIAWRLFARSSAAMAASTIDSRSLIPNFFLSILVDQNCFRQNRSERRHDDVEDQEDTGPEPFVLRNGVVCDQSVRDLDRTDQKRNQ